jgi:DNA polymerase-3 subunit delta'
MLALMTHARIGQALETDLRTIRATQDEFQALLSVPILRSVAKLLSAAEALHKADRVPEALDWITQWIRDLLLVRVGADSDFLVNLECVQELQQAAQTMEPEAMLDVLAEIEGIRRASARNINLQMAMETILLRLRDAVSSSAPAASAK